MGPPLRLGSRPCAEEKHAQSRNGQRPATSSLAICRVCREPCREKGSPAFEVGGSETSHGSKRAEGPQSDERRWCPLLREGCFALEEERSFGLGLMSPPSFGGFRLAPHADSEELMPDEVTWNSLLSALGCGRSTWRLSEWVCLGSPPNGWRPRKPQKRGSLETGRPEWGRVFFFFSPPDLGECCVDLIPFFGVWIQGKPKGN